MQGPEVFYMLTIVALIGVDASLVYFICNSKKQRRVIEQLIYILKNVCENLRRKYEGISECISMEEILEKVVEKLQENGDAYLWEKDIFL